MRTVSTVHTRTHWYTSSTSSLLHLTPSAHGHLHVHFTDPRSLSRRTMSEAEVEHVLISQLRDPRSEGHEEFAAATRHVARLPTEALVSALNEHVRRGTRRMGYTRALAELGDAYRSCECARGRLGYMSAHVRMYVYLHAYVVST